MVCETREENLCALRTMIPGGQKKGEKEGKLNFLVGGVMQSIMR